MRYEKKPGVLERESDGEIVLLDSETDQVHQLNRTAALVWRLCETESPISAIADELVLQFDVPWDIAERDAIAVVRQMTDLRLIVPAE